MRDNVDSPSATSHCEIREKVSNKVFACFYRSAISLITEDRSLGRPAIKRYEPRDTQIASKLSSPQCSIFKSNVEAMYVN